MCIWCRVHGCNEFCLGKVSESWFRFSVDLFSFGAVIFSQQVSSMG